MMELVSEEQVLGAVKSKGPVIPIEIRQIIKGGDSITIGATLSTLSDRGIVLITHLKRGGSPFYYVKGQEEKLSDLSKFLGEKDRRTFEALKERKILRDKVEEPLTRISLRNIPDFAKSVSIEFEGAQEIFWRWYMLPEEEMNQMLKTLGKVAKTEQEAPEPVDISAAKLKPQEPEKSRKAEEAVEQKAPRKKEKEQAIEENKTEKSEFLEVREEVQQKLSEGGNPQIISQFSDPFISKIGSFLAVSKIVIKEAKQIKKGAEYDLVLDIPTPVGTVEYFSKAKSKKKCNEGDLSSAYVQGQNMRLPVLFLTTGEVVKKAKEKQKTDFKGMILKELKI